MFLQNHTNTPIHTRYRRVQRDYGLAIRSSAAEPLREVKHCNTAVCVCV